MLVVCSSISHGHISDLINIYDGAEIVTATVIATVN